MTMTMATSTPSPAPPTTETSQPVSSETPSPIVDSVPSDQPSSSQETKEQDDASSSFGTYEFDASDDSGFSPDDMEECYEQCLRLKKKGNAYFQRRKLDDASRTFRRRSLI